LNHLRNITLLLLVSAVLSLAAEGGRIAGVVLDKSTGEPLAHANVFLNGTQMGSASKDNGYFNITHIPPGTYELVASVIGYKPARVKEVIVEAGKQRIYKIRLQPAVLELEGVSVQAQRASRRYDTERELKGHDIITPRQVTMQTGALDDAYRMISHLPSVTARNDLNTQLYIRGGSPDQNLVLYDGIEILMPSRLFVAMGGGISLVNPDLIESIDLVPAGFDAEFGNKMSGLMRITTREGSRKETTFNTSASLITARASAEGPLPGVSGSWLLAGRRSFYDLLANELYEGNYVFPYYYDLHGKLSIDLAADNRLILFGTYLSEGAQMYNVESEHLDLLNAGHGTIVGLRHSAILTPRLATNLVAGLYTDRNDLKVFDTYDYTYQARMNYDYRRYTVRADLHYYPQEWLRLQSGLRMAYTDTDVDAKVDWRTFVNVPDSLNFQAETMHTGVYWQARFEHADWFEYRLGLRYDYNTLYNEAHWNPRAKLITTPLPDVSLWLSSGLYSQFPDLMTIIGRGEPLDITRKPAMLSAEQALHNILGVEWRPRPGTSAKVELYRKDYDNMLVSQNDMFYTPENGGTGVAQGIEVSLSRQRVTPDDRFGLWAYYTLSEAKYHRDDSEQWIWFDYDRRHQVNLGLDLKVWGNWSVKTSWHWGSGFPYTPILAVQRDESANNGFVEGWTIVRDQRNSARYPEYSRLDLRLSYQRTGPGLDISAYIDLINVFNHRNVYMYEWDIYSSSVNSGAAQKSVMYMMPFVPAFGVSVEF
jgi:outer membrane cobalamin receptor